MSKTKLNSLLLTLLCLFVSMAVKADDTPTTTVRPTITDDSEVCIFLSTPDQADYTFHGYGGNYSTPTAFPGDHFTLVGQQADGMYLYKWTRPAGATGTPANFTLGKNYKAASEGQPETGKLGDFEYANHGEYMEVHEKTTTEVVARDASKTVTQVATGTDDPLAVLKTADEHSIFFETPEKNNYYFWAYNSDMKQANGAALEDGHFNTNKTFPGDQMELLGQVDNGNYLYKWTQTDNLNDMPATMIICKGDQDHKVFPDGPYSNHGYYVETITTDNETVSIRQYGLAFPSDENTTSPFDEKAYINSPNEVSIFLESTKDNADYYIWAYDDANGHDGTYFTGVSDYPGAKFAKVGQLSSNNHYLYKWTQNSHITDVPATLIISEGANPDNVKIIDGKGFDNHGYYTITYDASNKASYELKGEVTRQADGSFATSRTTFGKRVIYELNIGSFTQQGTFAAAKSQLGYLKNLGVDVIWLMPIYERGSSNSPYAVKNFKAVNPNYGTVDDLKDFVTNAHELGMDVWLDFVPNHAATNSIWLDENGTDYHPEYFSKDENGKYINPNGYKDVYQLDYTSLVEDKDTEGNVVDVYNPVDRAMRQTLEYWVNETDIDGFRFDYVSSPTIPNDVWKHLTTELKAIKPSLQFLAEADFIRDKNVSPSNFHYDYAWIFNDKLRAFGMSTNAYQDYDETNNPQDNPKDLSHFTNDFLKSIQYINADPMIYLINHDVNWNDQPNTMKGIWGDNRYNMTVMEFTLPGMPLIYNGQEQDGTQALNYFQDTKINWAGTRDYNMLGLLQNLAHLKHASNALNDGSNDTQRGETHILNSYEHSVIAYERVKGDEHIIVVLNLSNSVKSPKILGATKGEWTQILSGNNTDINTKQSTTEIGDEWNLANVPANGYMIFTMTSDVRSENEAPGIYFVGDDSWSNPTKHPMTASGTTTTDGKEYNLYKFTINASDFDELNPPVAGAQETDSNPLYFKFQEYYDWLNSGTICRTDQYFGAKTYDKDLVNGDKVDFAKDVENANNAFRIVKSDNISKYIITLARSVDNPNEGYITLETIAENAVQKGFYLLTPGNIGSSNFMTKHQWRFKDQYEDKDAVSDRYFETDNDEKQDLSSFTIDASDFDSFIPQDRKASNTIQFRINLFDGTNDNTNDIVPQSKDATTSASTFDASKDESENIYTDAYWQSFSDNPGYFKILYQPDVAKYIIQIWRTSSDGGKTRVRVYYVRKYNYTGSKIEDVAASNEDVYLYNVDAQKFLYVGNTWGTMASLLYDDLGTRLNISEGVTGENTDYKLIRTKLDGAGIVPNGTMLGIDDFGYSKTSDDPFNRLDSANIYCDRNNGNRWIIEKADSIGYANTYILKLFNIKDGRFHYMVADHMDGNSDEAKKKNTEVKYIAIDDKKYTVADLDDMNALQRNNIFGAVIRPSIFNRQYVGYLGENNGWIQFEYNTTFTGTYDISVDYMTREARPLNIDIATPDGKSKNYELTSGTTSSYDNYNRTETMHFTVNMQKGTNVITIADQAEAAPNIAGISITLKRPSDLTYGRWQFVTYRDLVNKLKNDNAELYGGTTADATFLLTDQGFTRNVTVSWNTDNGQTILDGSNTKSDVAFTKNSIGANPASGMYWNAHITGKGCVYQDVVVPMYGIYQFDAFGYYNGNPTRMYYQYATEFNSDGSVKSWSPMLGNTELKGDAPAYDGRNTDVNTGRLFYNESVMNESPEHKTTQFIYVPQTTQGAAVDQNGNYRLRIGFYKTGENLDNNKNDRDYTAVDDVHLHYCGKTPFLLRDTWTSTEKQDALTSDPRDNVPVWLEREFWVNKWNAVVLPVSVSTAQLRQIFGDGVEVATPYGLDDNNPYLIRFNAVNLNSGSTAIEAGKFYIVKPTKLVGTSKVMTVDDQGQTHENTVTDKDGWDIKYYDLGKHNLSAMLTDVNPLDVNTVDFQAYSKHDTTDHNSIRFDGTFYQTTAPKDSYVFVSDGHVWHLTADVPMGGFRFYITDIKKPGTETSKAFALGSLSKDLDAVLAAYNQNGNHSETTAINGVTTIDDANRTVNDGYVYDLSGRRVAINGKTDDLPGGVYIINGKKFIKK